MKLARLALLGALALGAPLAYAVSDAERVAAYQEFRAAFDAHHYQEALPLAQRLVSLTEEQYGPSDRALINPLANLGTTQYRLKAYREAEDSYLRSVKIASDTGSTADRALLRPLHGLGATYDATAQYEEASATLQRALDLSRNLDGLLNPGQLPILEPLVDALINLERHGEVDREFQYWVRVADGAFGNSDPRVIRPVDRYAHWLERMGRYPSARAEYARELTLAENAGAPAHTLVLGPLWGIARTYRLEALNGTEEGAAPVLDPLMQMGPGIAGPGPTRVFNSGGERALALALQTIDRSQPVDHAQRARALLELGDWYLCTGDAARSAAHYRDAWKELELTGGTALVAAPRQLAYRAPDSSATRSPLAERANSEEHAVEVTFTVTRDGHTTAVFTTSADATDAQQKSVLIAVRRARYAPRLENGEPVETSGVKLQERMLSKRPRPS